MSRCGEGCDAIAAEGSAFRPFAPGQRLVPCIGSEAAVRVDQKRRPGSRPLLLLAQGWRRETQAARLQQRLRDWPGGSPRSSIRARGAARGGQPSARQPAFVRRLGGGLGPCLEALPDSPLPARQCSSTGTPPAGWRPPAPAEPQPCPVAAVVRPTSPTRDDSARAIFLGWIVETPDCCSFRFVVLADAKTIRIRVRSAPSRRSLLERMGEAQLHLARNRVPLLL